MIYSYASTVCEPRSDSELDAEVLARLRAGDEDAFNDVVKRWSPAMLGLARTYVSNRQSAEDAVQDAWLGVLRGVGRFEGRSSFRTWVFSILVNRAKTRGVREARATPAADVSCEPPFTVDPGRFHGPNDPRARQWTSSGAPKPWHEPERRAVGLELLGLVEQALRCLPERQQAVVYLRDVQGLSAHETCAVLGLTPQNQRVILHRGRAAMRLALEEHYRS